MHGACGHRTNHWGLFQWLCFASAPLNCSQIRYVYGRPLSDIPKRIACLHSSALNFHNTTFERRVFALLLLCCSGSCLFVMLRAVSLFSKVSFAVSRFVPVLF